MSDNLTENSYRSRYGIEKLHDQYSSPYVVNTQQGQIQGHWLEEGGELEQGRKGAGGAGRGGGRVREGDERRAMTGG